MRQVLLFTSYKPENRKLKESYWPLGEACDFTSSSIVFQSCHDNERVIMKRFVQWNPIYS